MPLGLGIWEILILVGVLVLLFGAKGAPAMARKLGTSVREVKDAVTEMHPGSLLDSPDTKPKPAATPPREIEATPATPVTPAAPAASVAPDEPSQS